jgi:hypothetical protein
MTFTPWMPILQVGAAAPVAPYAIWVAAFTDYSPTGWQKCQWRFDPATGEVEYRGLSKTTGAISASNFKAIDTYMAVTPMLPKPTLHFMAIGQTSFTPALARNSAVARWDLRAPTGTEHHSINLEMAGTTGVATGNWFWLDAKISLATTPAPAWSAWMPVQAFGYAGAEINARFGTSTLANYGSWRPGEWRYSGNRIQVRGLMKTTAAQGVNDPLLIFKFPTALKPTRRVIIPNMINMNTTNGYQELARVDLTPHADGLQIIWAGWSAPSTGYFWLEMDMDLSYFTGGG